MKKVKPFDCPLRNRRLAAAHNVYRYRMRMLYNNAIKTDRWKRCNIKQFAYDRAINNGP